jgi:hypothetical protein
MKPVMLRLPRNRMFMTRLALACWLFSAAVLVAADDGSKPADQARLVSVARIWDRAEHNAFTDLLRTRGRWLCVFREGTKHASPDGTIRILESTDGKSWTSAAHLSDPGVDLRDPKISSMPDGRLMIVAGGSIMENSKYVSRQPRVFFSSDGRKWSSSQPILGSGHWLWRVTWHQGRAYGVSYKGGGGMGGPRSAYLFESADGLSWNQVADLALPNLSETTLRFRENGEMVAFGVVVHASSPQPPVRATGIGVSRPPYREWTWRELPYASGGPNFLIAPDGRWIASTRRFSADMRTTETVIAWLSEQAVQPFLTLPSGGDTSYAGLVAHEGELWVSFYSSHEGKAAIYLARARIPGPRS